MNKKTIICLIIFILIILIYIFVLSYIYKSEKTYTFNAYVIEVFNNRAIIRPIDSDELNFNTISANNITNVVPGQRIRITAQRGYRAVYPPIIEVINYETN